MGGDYRRGLAEENACLDIYLGFTYMPEGAKYHRAMLSLNNPIPPPRGLCRSWARRTLGASQPSTRDAERQSSAERHYKRRWRQPTSRPQLRQTSRCRSLFTVLDTRATSTPILRAASRVPSPDTRTSLAASTARPESRAAETRRSNSVRVIACRRLRTAHLSAPRHP